MGKALVIGNGADFSAVAVDKIDIKKPARVIADISDRFIIQDGYRVSTSGVTSSSTFSSRYKETNVADYAGKIMRITMWYYNKTDGRNTFAAIAFKKVDGYDSSIAIIVPQYDDDLSVEKGRVETVEVEIPSDVTHIAGTYVMTTKDYFVPFKCEIIEY